MAKLKIFKFPDLVLAKKAVPIPRVEKALHKLADDMLETMYVSPGVGLAANQVGLLDRILVIDADYEMEELPEGTEPPAGAEVVNGALIRNKKPRIIINPEIILREGNILFEEGCLSVPEFTAEVKRSEKLKLKYQDIDGLTRTLDAEGLLAIVIQHEIDHLDGKLFIDRLSPLKKEMVRKRLRKERAEREADELSGLLPSPSKKKGL
ncbi:MAG: peptide deformylase [Oligoflexia bacterium]|nr:peptide deformylase [Oligoflexia bacterium]